MSFFGVHGFKRLQKLLTRWRGGLLTAGTLLLMTVPESAAAPMFCIDLADLPAHALTGCGREQAHGAGRPAAPFAPAMNDAEAVSGDTLSRPPAADRPLVQVGRKALAESPGSEGRQRVAADPHGVRPARGASQSFSPETGSGLLEPQDFWTYLHLDRDGTYLFLGESADINEQIPFAVDDGFLPDGIGIGKRWPF